MGSKELKRLARQQQRQRKQRKQTIKGIAVSIFIVALIVLLSILLRPTTVSAVRIEPDPNGYLRIPRDSLQNHLNYINYGGTEELLVWEDDAGVIRTAFNTCEECYSGGNVNFTLSNEILTCNLCASTQPVSVLGTAEWGGCKPVSITPDMRDDTDTEVVISAAVLAYAKDVFLHWDASDFSVSFSSYGTDEAHTHE